MTKKELGKRIYDISYLTGNFTLRSGVYSNEYFDKYRFESEPEILRAVAAHMASMVPEGIEVLAGLELGGIPLVTALSFETGLPALYVRKEAKGHGTKKWAEGKDFKGKRICIIEDVVTTGGQIINIVQALRNEGGIVNHALCVISRSGKVFKNLEHSEIELKSLFSLQELKTEFGKEQ
jgi:orotate phosphoribosyltransferase